MERNGTVIIGNTECVILGGSEKALEQAAILAQSKKVTMVAGGIRLAGDICDTNRYYLRGTSLPFLKEKISSSGIMTPDQYQRELEEMCGRLGIQTLFFLRFVDCRHIQEKKLVRVAGKGGIFGIFCDSLTDCREAMEEDQYIGLVTSEGKSGYGLLQVTLPGWKHPGPGKAAADSGTGAGGREDTAHRLWRLRRALLEEFMQKQREDGSLRLGRFAVRGFGKTIPAAEYTGEQTDCYYAAGWNRFGRYPVLDQSEEETAVEAASEDWDLVIAGGGTAGVMAAIHGARSGLRTVLIEPGYDLGGTQTAGGVSTYWFGHRFLDVREIDGAVDEMCKACRVRKRRGIWSDRDDFHAGIRSYVYLEKCLEAGVKVVFGQIAYQAVCEQTVAGNCMRGILTAGDEGNRVYFGKAVIDATGDGDIAVSAGADHCYGSERDMITYWGSLAQYTSPDTYKNNFSSMLFSEDPLDYSRFVRLGRKRGGEIFDHGSYVSMRESRHIRGKYTVTLRDLITYRTYEDGLYTCYSNYDPKGKLDADMVYCGVLPPQVSIQIPLSSLLPVDGEGRQIRGLYVAGKAISATHNVFPSIRMQADLMHQGAVLGMLLGKALLSGRLPEELSDEERRKILLSCTDDPLTLPAFSKTPAECAAGINDRSQTHWVDAKFRFEETGTFDSLGIMAAVQPEDREAVKKILRGRLQEESDSDQRQALIGYALWHGMDDWTEELCGAICRKLESGRLPRRQASVMCAQLLPDHGVMPELVYQLNQLGFSRKRIIWKPFARVLELLETEDRDYCSIQKGIYHYIEAFAYAAERNPQPEFIPMIKRLLLFPELQDCVTKEEHTELLTERFQILVFLLNRALAGLGERQGLVSLAEMLIIDNMAIRGSVAMALRELTGADCGVSRRDWLKVIAAYVPGDVRRMDRKQDTKIW